MAAVDLTVDDLAPFASIEDEKAEAMIADALGMAKLVAPCITDEDFAHPDAAKAVLRGAILRWHEAGSGAYQQQQAGQFSVTMDTRQARRVMFWPSEIEQLQAMCYSNSGAYSIDTVDCPTVQHADICTLNFGGLYCSCGAVLTQAAALWENYP